MIDGDLSVAVYNEWKQLSKANSMSKILAINGAYRDDGITDQVVETMVQALVTAGVEVETVRLREFPIEFCLNCRHCTQLPGDAPGECVLEDGMRDLVAKIEQADGFILASPTNFGAVTAIFKRFLERLVVYAYWPWEQNAPRYRKADAPRKKALLVSSCAAPGLMGRWLYGTRKQLRLTAKTIGAQAVGTLFTGLVAKEQHPGLSPQVEQKARGLAARLVG